MWIFYILLSILTILFIILFAWAFWASIEIAKSYKEEEKWKWTVCSDCDVRVDYKEGEVPVCPVCGQEVIEDEEDLD